MSNPLFFSGSIPDFGSIEPEHYLPAIEKALDVLKKKLEKIKNDSAPAHFQNTVVPLENLFDDVASIQLLLSNRVSNTYTKELGEIEEKANIKISFMEKTVFQDPVLGQRFNLVYKTKDALNLDEDDKALLRNMHLFFESNGAFLPPEGQKKIRDIDEKLISLTQKFKDNMQASLKQQAVLITDPAELVGLSVEEIEGFATKEGWIVTPERLLVDELLERAEHSSFRKKIFKSLNNLGTEPPYDNRPVIAKLLLLRDDFAKLLGYEHYAAYARSRSMMADLDAVNALLTEITNKALPKFESDMKSLEDFAVKYNGPLKLEPWDVSYWALRQRCAIYHFDANAFSQYLDLENVLKGLFNEATRLFGLALSESNKYSTLHPDIRVFDVTDKDTGNEVGILHIDLYARPGTKNSGAWMNQIQSKTDTKPNIVIFNMNLARPRGGKPTLVGLSQYTTIYHEAGHCFQGLLGTHVKYRSQQGTSGPADFTEIHSTINEYRAILKENLQKYALNVRDGKPAPDAILDALVRSKSHFASRELLKLVQNSLRDLAFHSIAPKVYGGDGALEKSVAIKSDYADHICPYPLARFEHLFSDSHSFYAAGYVNYLIAGIHAADGFESFKADPYNTSQARLLAHFYRRGSGGDPFLLYRDYRGKDATPDALLVSEGIIERPKRG